MLWLFSGTIERRLSDQVDRDEFAMTEQPQSLRAIFATADSRRKELEASWDTNSASYQENLTATTKLYEQCIQLADSVSLFSPNESLDDISTNDLQCVEQA